MTDEQATMIWALQAQMEELRQKSVADQLRNEENQRRHAKEISLLRKQNRSLQQLLESHEQGG